MSKLNQAWLDALAEKGITTAQLLRLEFRSETLFVWTGGYAITPTSSGDTKLDGNTFAAFASGTPVDIGDNSYSTQGSNALTLSLSLPASLPDVLQLAEIDESEYLARPAYMWRAVMVAQAGLATPATWLFKRVRTGVIDTLVFGADGSSFNAKLTIGSHASYISAASQSRYSDQRRFDPNDTSQDYQYTVTGTQAISNAPSYASNGNTGAGGGNFGITDYQYE